MKPWGQQTMFRLNSIRLKVTLLLVTGVVLALLSAMGSMAFFEYRATASRVRISLESTADAVQGSLLTFFDFNDQKKAEERLQQITSGPVLASTLLRLGDAPSVFASSMQSGVVLRFEPQVREPGLYRNNDRALLVRSLQIEGQPVALFMLEADVSAFRRGFQELLITLGLVFLTLLTASVFIIRIFQSGVTRPILRLSETAEKVHLTDDFSLRAPVETQDEVGRLSASFNEMLSGIETRDRQLAESTRFQKAVMEGAGAAVITVDQSYRVCLFNQAAERLLGYKASEVIGQTTLDLFHQPEELVSVAISYEKKLGVVFSPPVAVLGAIAHRESVFIREWTYLRKNRMPVPVHLVVSELAGGTDGFNGFCVVATDLSERKAAEAALQSSELRFRTLAESGVCGIMVREGVLIRYVNPCMAQMLGYGSPEALVGRDVTTLLEAETRKDFYERDQRLARGEAIPVAKEAQFFRKDGSLIWVAVGSVVSSWDGRPVVQSAIVDITERKEAEAARREVEAFRKRVFESSRMPIVVMDIETLRFVDCNPAAVEIYQFHSREETLQKTVLDVSAAEQYDDAPSQKKARQYARKALEEGSTSFEWKHRRPSGELWDAEVHLMSFQSGDKEFLQFTLQDITEHKRYASMEMEKAKAEAANRAKSVFLASMSHEIRTPLNAILGFTQLMNRDVSLSVVQREHLRIIGRSGEHLLTLINDILEMSKIEAQQVTLQALPFNVGLLARDLHSMFKSNAMSKGLQLRVELSPKLPEHMVGDEGRLRQILVNLLGNAIKFTERGQVAMRLDVALQDDGRWLLRVEVEDTGPGIGSDEIGRLFQPFEQARLGRRSGMGTGLGLAISREFARMMGGDIQVISHVGKGSLFRVEVFLGKADEVVIVQKTKAMFSERLKGAARGRSVLIADDLAENRQLLRELLSPLGFEIFEACSGLEAVEGFERLQPDLVLMDLRMPELDGYEATRRIRALPRGKQVKILCLSASVFMENRARSLEVGADSFLGKPFRDEELFEKLAELLLLQPAVVQEALHTSAMAAEVPVLVKLPPALRNALYKAVLELDMDRIEKLIEDIKGLDAAYAMQLHDYAVKFDYEKLLALLPANEEGAAP